MLRPRDAPVPLSLFRNGNGCRLRQALRELGRQDVCAECGTGPVCRGKALSLEVDHVNGDWSDNRIENLRILCPNCHAVTDTYCGRNKRRTVETTGRTPE